MPIPRHLFELLLEAYGNRMQRLPTFAEDVENVRIFQQSIAEQKEDRPPTRRDAIKKALGLIGKLPTFPENVPPAQLTQATDLLRKHLASEIRKQGWNPPTDEALDDFALVDDFYGGFAGVPDWNDPDDVAAWIWHGNMEGDFRIFPTDDELEWVRRVAGIL